MRAFTVDPFPKQSFAVPQKQSTVPPYSTGNDARLNRLMDRLSEVQAEEIGGGAKAMRQSLDAQLGIVEEIATLLGDRSAQEQLLQLRQRIHSGFDTQAVFNDVSGVDTTMRMIGDAMIRAVVIEVAHLDATVASAPRIVINHKRVARELWRAAAAFVERAPEEADRAVETAQSSVPQQIRGGIESLSSIAKNANTSVFIASLNGLSSVIALVSKDTAAWIDEWTEYLRAMSLDPDVIDSLLTPEQQRAPRQSKVAKVLKIAGVGVAVLAAGVFTKWTYDYYQTKMAIDVHGERSQKELKAALDDVEELKRLVVEHGARTTEVLETEIKSLEQVRSSLASAKLISAQETSLLDRGLDNLRKALVDIQSGRSVADGVLGSLKSIKDTILANIPDIRAEATSAYNDAVKLENMIMRYNIALGQAPAIAEWMEAIRDSNKSFDEATRIVERVFDDPIALQRLREEIAAGNAVREEMCRIDPAMRKDLPLTTCLNFENGSAQTDHAAARELSACMFQLLGERSGAAQHAARVREHATELREKLSAQLKTTDNVATRLDALDKEIKNIINNQEDVVRRQSSAETRTAQVFVDIGKARALADERMRITAEAGVLTDDALARVRQANKEHAAALGQQRARLDSVRAHVESARKSNEQLVANAQRVYKNISLQARVEIAVAGTIREIMGVALQPDDLLVGVVRATSAMLGLPALTYGISAALRTVRLAWRLVRLDFATVGADTTKIATDLIMAWEAIAASRSMIKSGTGWVTQAYASVCNFFARYIDMLWRAQSAIAGLNVPAHERSAVQRALMGDGTNTWRGALLWGIGRTVFFSVLAMGAGALVATVAPAAALPVLAASIAVVKGSIVKSVLTFVVGSYVLDAASHIGHVLVMGTTCKGLYKSSSGGRSANLGGAEFLRCVAKTKRSFLYRSGAMVSTMVINFVIMSQLFAYTSESKVQDAVAQRAGDISKAARAKAETLSPELRVVDGTARAMSLIVPANATELAAANGGTRAVKELSFTVDAAALATIENATQISEVYANVVTMDTSALAEVGNSMMAMS